MIETLLGDHRILWTVAALIILLFATANLPWQLDDYDQAKQAFTSFEMVKEGHWFYQHTPHEHVATKPPLVGWISVALFVVTRSWEIAWRLPSLLAALVLAVVLFRAAKYAYGSTAALIALGAFGFNLLSPRLATLVRTDMPLAFVILLIGLLIWNKIRAGTQWRLREQICLFVLLTAAVLIKGPIVYAFLLPGIAVFEWWCRRHVCCYTKVVAGDGDPGQNGCSHGALSPMSSELRSDRLDRARRPHVCPGWWPWVASLAFFLVWVAGGIRFQPGFYDEVLMREFVGRFGETIHRPQPLLFYFPHLLHKFAPWSVLMIAIALVDLHSRRWRLRGIFREMSPETLWLLCWSIGGLIAMSVIPSKRVDRIFPVVPPLCLLLAAQVGTVGALRRPPDAYGTARRSYLMVALAIAIIFTGGYTGWKMITGYRDHRDGLAVFGRNVRHEVEAHHWRYEVVSARDEGLLLYLRKTHFIDPQLAIPEWNSGNLDALVTSAEKATTMMPNLRGATFFKLKSDRRKSEQGTAYVLLVR